MLLSFRRQRASLYAYTDVGANGRMASQYVKRASSAADGNWWCARSQPTGREITLTAQAGESIDAVFQFADEVLVDTKDAIVLNARAYRVLAVLPPDGVERVSRVLARTVTLASLTLVDA